jgi:hypothetical protein
MIRRCLLALVGAALLAGCAGGPTGPRCDMRSNDGTVSDPRESWVPVCGGDGDGGDPQA